MKFWSRALLNRFVLYSFACFLAFLFGRFTAPVNNVTKTKQEVNQTVTRRVIVRVKRPSGETRTTVTEDINSNTRKDETIIIKQKPKVNVSALVGVDLTGKSIPAYGISINKEFVGPITVGAYGLTNGVVGLSIGVNF